MPRPVQHIEYSSTDSALKTWTYRNMPLNTFLSTQGSQLKPALLILILTLFAPVTHANFGGGCKKDLMDLEQAYALKGPYKVVLLEDSDATASLQRTSDLVQAAQVLRDAMQSRPDLFTQADVTIEAAALNALGNLCKTRSLC